MKKENIQKLIMWIKRIVGASAGILWIVVIFKISQSGLPFAQQALICIANTMLFTAILTALYKVLQKWESSLGE